MEWKAFLPSLKRQSVASYPILTLERLQLITAPFLSVSPGYFALCDSAGKS
jgi:hypothetical protein